MKPQNSLQIIVRLIGEHYVMIVFCKDHIPFNVTMQTLTIMSKFSLKIFLQYSFLKRRKKHRVVLSLTGLYRTDFF